MPDETGYHTVITPRVPLYAYSYGRDGEAFEIFCDQIVAFAFYYVEGMNINIPLVMGFDCLEDPTTWDSHLGISTAPDLTLENWKAQILSTEERLKQREEDMRKREEAERNRFGKDIRT
jgi:hypothetical protein